MIINPSIFKGYDIRAIYPQELDEDGVYNIGRAFVEFLGVKEVVLGNDMRVSVPYLRPHLIAGLTDAGAKIIDIGMTGTELMYFTVGKYNHESGIMITASHNPAEYIGMKMVRQGGIPLSGDSGIMDIRDLALKNKYQRLNLEPQISNFDPVPAYKQKVKSIANFDEFKPYKIVVDAGNGVGGIIFNKIFGDTNLEIIPMYFEPDGTFPNHEANPIKEENTTDLRKKVVEEKADLGIALDGDGDRVFFIDKDGNYTLGYFLVAILLKRILDKYPGAKIVYENRNKWAIEDEIDKYNGIPIKCKAGTAFLREKLRSEDAMFAGETSSHFIYKDMYFADSSMLSIALLLDIMSETGQSLDQLLKPFRNKYFMSGEINFEVKDADTTLEKIKEIYLSQGLELDEIDGIAFDKGREWRFSLRKSNTEPVVRLNIEGDSQEIVDQKVKEISALITE